MSLLVSVSACVCLCLPGSLWLVPLLCRSLCRSQSAWVCVCLCMPGSVSLSLCLGLCLSLSAWVCVCLCLPESVSVSVCLGLCGRFCCPSVSVCLLGSVWLVPLCLSVCLCPSRSARVSGCVAGSVILYFVCLYLSVSVCLGLWLCGWFCYFVCLCLSLSAWVSVAVWLVPLFCLYLSAWVSGLMAGCLSAQKLQGLWYVSSRVSVCVCVCARAGVGVCVCQWVRAWVLSCDPKQRLCVLGFISYCCLREGGGGGGGGGGSEYGYLCGHYRSDFSYAVSPGSAQFKPRQKHLIAVCHLQGEKEERSWEIKTLGTKDGFMPGPPLFVFVKKEGILLSRWSSAPVSLYHSAPRLSFSTASP